MRPLSRAIQYLTAGGLQGRLMRGGVWLALGSVTEQSFRLARNIVLTRLLAPEAFGLMAIVLSTSSIVDTFTEIGMKEAVIQNPQGATREYVNTAWWISLVRGLALYGLVFVAAPGIAHFYRNDDLTNIMRVSLLSVVFFGAISSGAYAALKEMKFAGWTLIQHGSGLCGSLFAIGLALALRSVWALALGLVIESAIRCLVSHLLYPLRPSLSIDRQAMRDLLQFSKGIFGLSFLNLLFSRADIFVIGKLFSTTDLGIYSMAVYLVQTPTSFCLTFLGQLFMPAFSQMQTHHARVNEILRRVSATLLVLGVPILVFTILSSGAILSTIYGHRYASATAVLSVAAIVSLVIIVNGQITTAFYALGVPQLHRRCVVTAACVMLICIFPAVHIFGSVGGQLAALAAIIIGYITQILQIRRLTQCEFAGSKLLLSVAALGSLGILLMGRYSFFPRLTDSGLVSGSLAASVTFVFTWTLLSRQLKLGA